MDSSKETRWQQRFDNLKKAYRLLEEAAGRQSLSDLEAEGMIQRFEYTFELAWKTLKDLLSSEGVDASFPREVIKESFQHEVISHGDTWMEMLERRNQAAHAYNEDQFREIVTAIRARFVGAIGSLVATLEQRLGRFGLSEAALAGIVTVLQSHPSVKTAVVFGSRAMGTQRPGSDIDICIAGTELDESETNQIARDLNERIPSPYRIDVILRDSIDNDALLQHIDQYGVPILER